VTARRLPNGLLRPEFADLLEGARVARELNLDPATIPHPALIAMGRAVSDRDMAGYSGPVYPNGGRDIEMPQDLDRIGVTATVRRYSRPGQRAGPGSGSAPWAGSGPGSDDARAWHNRFARHSGIGKFDRYGTGQGRSAWREQPKNH